MKWRPNPALDGTVRRIPPDRGTFKNDVPTLRQRFATWYLILIALIAAGFVWQMVHGICPVP